VSFAHPALLWLALLVLPELLLARLRSGALRSSVAALAGPRLRPRASAAYATASFYGTVAGALFIVSAALTLAGPSWGSRGTAAERSGVEASFVLDVSRSMLATDLAPTRLDAAKALIRGLIHGADGVSPRIDGSASASFALVADKGDAVLLSPMTEDIDSLDGALDYADPDTLTSPGTDLERGIQVGLAAFSTSSAADRVLILLSDGGELTGSAAKEAEALRKEQVRFIAVGLGGSAPAFVPAPDGSPLILSSGLPARSALEAERLRGLAAAAGGRYLDGEDPGTSAALAAEIAQARKGGTKVELQNVDRSGLTAALALLFLVAAIVADILATRGGRT